MKHLRIHSMLAGLVLCGGLFGVSTASFAGKWEAKALLLRQRWGLDAETVNGKIYAIGGQDDLPAAGKRIAEYDLGKDQWTEKKSIPTGRFRIATGMVRGKIYVFGGTANNFEALPTVEEYDPKTDTWTKKADMPTARLGLSAAVVGGKIYTIGGAESFFFSSGAVEVYDPVSDTWEQKADMPNPRWGAAGAAVPGKGKIYIFGGATDFTHKESTTEVDEYDTKTEIWTPKAKIQRPVHNFAAAFVNSGKIYVMGGEKWKGKGGVKGGGNDPELVFYDDVWEYDPEVDKWSRMESMPTARGSFGTAVADGKIYIMGGWNGGAGAQEIENEAYQPPGWPFPDKFSVDPREKLATVWGALKTR